MKRSFGEAVPVLRWRTVALLLCSLVGCALLGWGTGNAQVSSPLDVLAGHPTSGQAAGAGSAATASGAPGVGSGSGAGSDRFARAIEGVVDCQALLRVRAWPWGRIIGGLHNRDKVKVLGVAGDFYQIEYEGRTAYAHRNYITINGSPSRTYGIQYPPGCAEGGNGYLPRPGADRTRPDDGSSGSGSNDGSGSAAGSGSREPTGSAGVDYRNAKTIGDVRGDGTRIGAVGWAYDQTSGGRQRGINSNNGKRSSDPTAWNHYCLAFVATAWGRKVNDLAAASAWLAYKRCVAAGRTFHKSGTPPPGAAMFTAATSRNPYGHAFIATGEVDRHGDPIVLSTSGWGGMVGIQRMTLSKMKSIIGAPYLGWTALP